MKVRPYQLLCIGAACVAAQTSSPLIEHSVVQQELFPNLALQTTNERWHSFSFSSDFSLYWRLLRDPATTGEISWISPDNSTWVEMIFSAKFRGWVAIGLGTSNMFSADVLVLHRPTPKMTSAPYSGVPVKSTLNYTVEDCSTLATIRVYLDQQLPKGTQDVVMESAHITDHSMQASFRRKLNTGDIYDVLLRPGRIPLVMAFGTDYETVASHGILHRDAYYIDFFRDEIGYDGASLGAADGYFPGIKNRNGMYVLVHGILMFIIYMVLIPFGLYAARFWPDPQTWISVHQTLMTVAISESLAVAMTSAITGNLALDSPHALLGLFTASCGIVLALFGWTAKQEWTWKHPYCFWVRPAHRIFGVLFALTGVGNCMLGLFWAFKGQRNQWAIMLSVSFSWIAFYAGFLFVFHRLRGLERIQDILAVLSKKDLDEETNIGLKKLQFSTEKLHPEFSQTELQDRITNGAKWLVIDGAIYNVGQFMRMHPGGENVFLEWIGRDATAAFFPERSQVPVKSGNGSPTSPLNSLRRRLVRGRDMHIHSRLARHQLQSLLVGTLKIDDTQAEPSTAIRNQPLRTAKMMESTNRDVHVNDIRVSLLEHPASYRAKVIRFELKSPSNAVDRVYLVEVQVPDRIRPWQVGDIFRFAHDHDKQLARVYTPISVETFGIRRAQFLIKIYNEGLFTSQLEAAARRHQQEMTEHFLQVEGPLPNRNSHPLKSLTGTFPFKHIACIAAGTGVTPMLLNLEALAHSGMPAPQGYLWIACHRSWQDAQFYQEFLMNRRQALSTGAHWNEHYFFNIDTDGRPKALSTVATLQSAAQLEPLFAQANIDRNATLFLVCGPPKFSESVEKMLVNDCAIPARNVYLE